MKNIAIKKILIGTSVSLILSLILLLLLTLAVYFGDFADSTVSGSILFIIGFSVLCGAFILARNIVGGGLINGLMLGALYFLVLLAISACVKGPVAFDLQNVTRLVIILAAGMLGGVVGINSAS